MQVDVEHVAVEEFLGRPIAMGEGIPVGEEVADVDIRNTVRASSYPTHRRGQRCLLRDWFMLASMSLVRNAGTAYWSNDSVHIMVLGPQL